MNRRNRPSKKRRARERRAADRHGLTLEQFRARGIGLTRKRDRPQPEHDEQADL